MALEVEPKPPRETPLLPPGLPPVLRADATDVPRGEKFDSIAFGLGRGRPLLYEEPK
jgi:hypothetical protein